MNKQTAEYLHLLTAVIPRLALSKFVKTIGIHSGRAHATDGYQLVWFAADDLRGVERTVSEDLLSDADGVRFPSCDKFVDGDKGVEVNGGDIERLVGSLKTSAKNLLIAIGAGSEKIALFCDDTKLLPERMVVDPVRLVTAFGAVPNKSEVTGAWITSEVLRLEFSTGHGIILPKITRSGEPGLILAI